jgi:carbonic anhydrase/acetyltransferase-like protein (isoleucine patch superfamily)
VTAGGVILSFGRHRPKIHPSAFVTEGTYVIGRVTLARRASVWFGAVLRGDFGAIVVGEESLVEDNVVLHGGVVVGKRCVIGHGAVLHGCVVGDEAVIGANAVVFDGATVGRGALVAIGSVVYPGVKVPAHTVFRNAAGGNHPVIEPIGGRRRRWNPTTYRRIISVYQERPVTGRGAVRRPRRRAKLQGARHGL